VLSKAGPSGNRLRQAANDKYFKSQEINFLQKLILATKILEGIKEKCVAFFILRAFGPSRLTVFQRS
jgi:hypothetical protein